VRRLDGRLPEGSLREGIIMQSESGGTASEDDAAHRTSRIGHAFTHRREEERQRLESSGLVRPK